MIVKPICTEKYSDVNSDTPDFTVPEASTTSTSQYCSYSIAESSEKAIGDSATSGNPAISPTDQEGDGEGNGKGGADSGGHGGYAPADAADVVHGNSGKLNEYDHSIEADERKCSRVIAETKSNKIWIDHISYGSIHSLLFFVSAITREHLRSSASISAPMQILGMNFH